MRLRKLEQKRKQKERMLKVLSKDELKGIDVDSEEGFTHMEHIVNDKLAEKLVAELEGILNPKSLREMELSADGGGGLGTFAFKRVFADDLLASVGGTEISKKLTFLDMVNQYIWDRRGQVVKEKSDNNEDSKREFNKPDPGKSDELHAVLKGVGDDLVPGQDGRNKISVGEKTDTEVKGMADNDEKIAWSDKGHIKAESPVDSMSQEHPSLHLRQHDFATGTNLRDVSGEEERREDNADNDESAKREHSSIADKGEHKEGGNFDVELERKVRSDVVTEDDMLEELSDAVAKLPEAAREETETFAKSKQFQKKLQEVLEEIVEETELETGTRLDRSNLEGENVLSEWSDTIQDLIAKVEKADKQLQTKDKEIQQVNLEIEELKKRAAELEEPSEADGADGHEKGDDEEIERHKDSEPQEAEEEETLLGEEMRDAAGLFRDESQRGDDVKIKVTDLTQLSAIKNSPTERKVTQRLESVIKQKLSKAGLDTGGRQIEVKLVTTTSIGSLDGLGGDRDGVEETALNGDGEKDISGEEQQQFQNMIYNLMVSYLFEC